MGQPLWQSPGRGVDQPVRLSSSQVRSGPAIQAGPQWENGLSQRNLALSKLGDPMFSLMPLHRKRIKGQNACCPERKNPNIASLPSVITLLSVTGFLPCEAAPTVLFHFCLVCSSVDSSDSSVDERLSKRQKQKQKVKKRRVKVVETSSDSESGSDIQEVPITPGIQTEPKTLFIVCPLWLPVH